MFSEYRLDELEALMACRNPTLYREHHEFQRRLILALFCPVILVVSILLILRKCFGRKRESKEWTDRMVESLCKQDAPNIDERDKYGLAPLHVALSNGCPESARKLIERGASVDCATTYRKNTPLHYALRVKNHHRSNGEIAEFLLNRGADPNRKNRWGNCPLHMVVSHEDSEGEARMVRRLLDAGAHVDVRNDKGHTPLGFAFYFGKEACVEELLSRGANIYDKWIGMLLKKYGAVEVIRKHWIKLRAAGLRCPEDWDVDAVVKADESLYRECLAEVDALKGTFVDSSTSLYRFLHMDSNDRCIYVNDEKLKNVFDYHKLREEFPNYVVLIMGSYNEAATRKSLLEPATEAWLGITKMHLPDVCIKRILNYLSNADLLELIEKYKNDLETSNSDKIDMSFREKVASFLFDSFQ